MKQCFTHLTIRSPGNGARWLVEINLFALYMIKLSQSLYAVVRYFLVEKSFDLISKVA